MGGGGEATPVGGDIMLAPTEAAGQGGTRPGGTKCIRSDLDGSGREGGSGEPPIPAATPADGGRVASAAGFLKFDNKLYGTSNLIINYMVYLNVFKRILL